PVTPPRCATARSTCARLSGEAAVRGRDVRQGARDQLDAGVAGCARGTAGDTARAQTWWQCRTRLHCQLWPAKGGRYGVAHRCWLCPRANRGHVEALLRGCDKAMTCANDQAWGPPRDPDRCALDPCGENQRPLIQ